MKLKDYQEKVLTTLEGYLKTLADEREKYRKAVEFDAEFAAEFNFPKRAWKKSTGSDNYHSKTNGLGEPLPDIYLKVPTGGGKTLLACHGIDLINKHYIFKQTGLVLWIVPSTQIYRQTISRLKDRNDPYRQVLDISSGGRTLIREKTDVFTRSDVEENLVILMLMLPSANRQNRETLKIFQDASGFVDFFPPEDDFPAQEKIDRGDPKFEPMERLGAELGNEAVEWTNQRQIQTSLGNTLRLLKPLVIMDEGHKAYGTLARDTIATFNPSFVLELSATPPPGSNKLVEVTGKELDDEEMIKLDLHLKNNPSPDWKDTMTASYAMRVDLENKAKEYKQNTDINIRPICLIQAERTGRDQIEAGYIHSEHVKEYLINQCGVPESHIAIKTSEKDDLEGIDLLAADCPIRYIITKQALQEGWDCPFAYVLTILTNPQSGTAITQLVGRILRQPFARKTGVQELDECYVFTFQRNAATLVSEIKIGLESEGLGDIAGRVVGDGGGNGAAALPEKKVALREKFKQLKDKIFLPNFAVKDSIGWRPIKFETDILARIDWTQINISAVDKIVLSQQPDLIRDRSIGYRGKKLDDAAEGEQRTASVEIDEVFLAQQLSDIIPNPWICFEAGEKALAKIRKKNKDASIVAANFVFIIEEIKKILSAERDRLAKAVFEKMINDGDMFFYIIGDGDVSKLLVKKSVKSRKRLNRINNDPIEKSLVDYVADEDLNDLEKPVASYLDERDKLVWWYRNVPRHGYFVQGWRRHRIFPDFLAAKTSQDEADRILVLETKGTHLKNEDTDYKKAVFDLCNMQEVKTVVGKLPAHNEKVKYEFSVVFGDNWQNEINRIFQ